MSSSTPSIVVGPSLSWRGATHPVSLDDLVSLLETVGTHLENRDGGSRFPQLWLLVLALSGDGDYGWSRADLAELRLEIDAIETESQSLPASLVPTFAFGDEGFPEIFFRTSPNRPGTAGSHFRTTFATLRSAIAEAQARESRLLVERRGVPIAWFGL